MLNKPVSRLQVPSSTVFLLSIDPLKECCAV